MSKTGLKSQSCTIGVWAMAAFAGFVAFVMLMVVGKLSFMGSIFSAAIMFILLGAVLGWILCRPLPSLAEVKASSAGTTTGASGVAAAADNAPEAGAEAGAEESGTIAARAEEAVATVAETAKDVAHKAVDAAKDAAHAVTDAAKDVAHKASDVAHKAADTAKGAAEAVTETAKDAVHAATDAAKDVAHKASDVAQKAADTAKDAAQAVTETAKEAVQTATETASDTAQAMGGAASAATSDAPAAEGVRPAALSAARGGKADNLKEIKGIGPKMEKLCNTLGFYHFDQIASWTADEVAWVDANLEGFRGRVTRDEWVKQAKILAAGGETEFSKRVEDGGVY